MFLLRWYPTDRKEMRLFTAKSFCNTLIMKGAVCFSLAYNLARYLKVVCRRNQTAPFVKALEYLKVLRHGKRMRTNNGYTQMTKEVVLEFCLKRFLMTLKRQET